MFKAIYLYIKTIYLAIFLHVFMAELP